MDYNGLEISILAREKNQNPMFYMLVNKTLKWCFYIVLTFYYNFDSDPVET